MAEPPSPMQRTALMFPQDCPECGSTFPAGTQANTECPTCKAKARENARVALARAQARQWAAELKAAQEKHARVQQGPASMQSPASVQSPVSAVNQAGQRRQRRGSVPELGTPDSVMQPSIREAPPSSGVVGSPSHDGEAYPRGNDNPRGNRINLARGLAQSIVEAVEAGDLTAARIAYEALGQLLWDGE